MDQEEKKQNLKEFLKKEKEKIGGLLKDTYHQKSQMRAELAEKKTLKLPSIKRKTESNMGSSGSFDLKDISRSTPQKRIKGISASRNEGATSNKRLVSKSSEHKSPPRKK